MKYLKTYEGRHVVPKEGRFVEVGDAIKIDNTIKNGEKLLSNSKMVNNYEVMETQLVDELTKSINNEILKKIREIGGGNMNFSYTTKRD